MFFKRIDDIVLVEIILFCTSPLNIKEIDDNTHNAARINFRITTIEDEKLREQYWFFKLHKEIFLNTNVSTDSSFILPFVCKGESELLEKLKEKLPHKEEAELDNLLLFFESALADWLPEWIYLTHDEEGAANFFNFVPTIIGRVGYEVRVVEKGGLEN